MRPKEKERIMRKQFFGWRGWQGDRKVERRAGDRDG